MSCVHIRGPETLAYIAWQFDVASGKKPSGLCQLAMNGKEIPPWDAITVSENQVVASAGQDGPVQNLGLAKAGVLVPNPLYTEGKLVPQPFDAFSGLGARSIVGEHHLKVLDRLLGKAT
jgi:hypothetical protein